MHFSRLLRPLRVHARRSCRAYAASPASDVNKSSPPSHKSQQTKSSTPVSSCPADTILPGVNYLKGQDPVIAQADDQYPQWLWTILQSKVWPDDGPGGKAEQVQRRQENRQRIKERNFMSTQ
ncbi:hypothetical protein AMATHDRAFT_41029 [Amanita thiersii Skay4041]|uniref:Large ribosomal subunit protein mL54 n=1 Tax=Amanita thiersii Skay4041 TaxID=703135 RepID=A0A2A9NR12_9AGAR|nr:hypothetical protein AMATHDRAFT_41029 [Amanita thiersii Skay4041]